MRSPQIHRNCCWRLKPNQQSFRQVDLQRAVHRQPSYRAGDCWVGVHAQSALQLIPLQKPQHFSGWIAEAVAFLQMNYRRRYMSKKEHMWTWSRTSSKLIIWSSPHAQNDPHRNTKLRWKSWKSNFLDFWWKSDPRRESLLRWEIFVFHIQKLSGWQTSTIRYKLARKLTRA